MIGERLEEARKRKGISIRQAADATKIRGTYLESMEDNSFNIPLPTIYIRGFLKNYARYLKLDPQKVLTDFDAQQMKRSLGAPASPVRHRKETYGHLEIEPASYDLEAEQDSVPIDQSEPAPKPLPLADNKTASFQPAESTGQEPADSWQDNKALYLKITIGLAGFIIVTIFLIQLIRLIAGSGSQEINPEIERPASTVTESTPEPSRPVEPEIIAPDNTIVITASDNVTLIVEQTLDRSRLYSGSLNAGESVSLERNGPVSIRFSNGSAIRIQTGDRSVEPSQSGVGRTVVE